MKKNNNIIFKQKKNKHVFFLLLDLSTVVYLSIS